MDSVRGPKVVVIGGGTGTFTILSALKHYMRDITAVVNMSDDGGSTGVLRDELGALPPGDIRQCLVALSESDEVLRELFNYRFEEGIFGGHAFGNLFLTALEKTTGSFAKAVETAGEVLNIVGRVVPVTLEKNELVLVEKNGTIIRGEHAITEHHLAKQRPTLYLEPAAKLNPEAEAAIAAADLVVIAPGNLYGSLAPVLIADGMADALAATSAKIIAITNLVTKPGQTDGFGAQDFAAEIERFVDAPILDYVLYNQTQPTKQLLAKYAKAGEFAVKPSIKALEKAHYKAIGADLVSNTVTHQNPNDTMLQRTLIRHDSDKIARLIMRIYFS